MMRTIFTYRRYRRMALLGLVVAALALPAVADDSSYQQSYTWPPMEVYVTSQNGWAVAVGQSTGDNTRIMWRTPLAPVSGGMTIQHGPGTTFVQIGSRAFVIKDSNGKATELRPGQAVSATHMPRQKAHPKPQSKPQPTQDTPTREVAPEESSGDPPPPVSGNVDPAEVADARAAVVNANQKLLQALEDLDHVYTLRKQKLASDQQLQQAIQAVKQAKKAATNAQNALLRKASPNAAAISVKSMPAVKPAADQPEPTTIQGAEARVNKLLAQKANVEGQLRQAAVSQNQVAIQRAEDRAEAIEQQLILADTQLQKLRMREDELMTKITPAMKAKIQNAEQIVKNLMDAEQVAATQSNNSRAAYYNGRKATLDQVQKDQQRLMSIIRRRTAAQQELDQLRREALTQVEAKSTTMPAEQ